MGLYSVHILEMYSVHILELYSCTYIRTVKNTFPLKCKVVYKTEKNVRLYTKQNKKNLLCYKF